MHVDEMLEAGLASMRPSEAAVVRRLLRGLGRVATDSLREVAAWCGTSDTTVMRACRAAGFDGFQDLKYRVLRDLTSRAGSKPTTTRPVSYAEDLEATLWAGSAASGHAALLLRRASRVAIAGVGASLGVGLVLTDVLFTLGKQALPLESEEALSFVLTPPVRGLVLLAISHSGETRFPLRAVCEARSAGVKTLALTNEPASELARAADLVLPTRCVERPEGSFAITPRICQLAALDRLLERLQAQVHARPPRLHPRARSGQAGRGPGPKA